MENHNPDTRPLPPGWVTQFDINYRTWYYVNTKAQPAEITWNHPLGPPPTSPPPQNQYGPPAGPPPPGSSQPDNRGYNQASSFPSSPGGGYGYNNSQGYGGYNGPPQGGYHQTPPPQEYGGYGSPPPQQGYGGPQYGGYQGGWNQSPPPVQHQESSKGAGGLLGKLMGGSKPQQQPQQVVYQQGPPKKSGPGMGSMMALGAGGLLAGGLIGASIADNENDAYMDGFQDGQDGDFDGGDW